MGPKQQTKTLKVADSKSAEEMEQDGATGQPTVVRQSREETTSLDMNAIAAMLEKCLQCQKDFADRWDKEECKQERRWRQLQVQVGNLRDEVEMRQKSESPPQPGPSSGADEEPVFQRRSQGGPVQRAWTQSDVPKFQEGDDIEQYLTTFERLAAAYQWAEEDWAVRLVPHLTGRARAAYVAMAVEDACDYAKVKAAILTKYEINEELYRQRFRDPEVRAGETPREFYNRLKDLYLKWMQPQKRTKEEMGEILILEQFYTSLSPELRVWVKERNPTSAQEAAELVENFLAARRGPKAFRHSFQQKPSFIQGKSVGSGLGGGPGQVTGVEKPRGKTFPSAKLKSEVKPIVCYGCGQEGHIKPECPLRKAKSAYFCTVPRPVVADQFQGKKQVMEVRVNGKLVTALLDTGSVQTLIHPSILEDQCYLEGPGLNISCVHGDHKTYPTAAVYLEVYRLLGIKGIRTTPYHPQTDGLVERRLRGPLDVLQESWVGKKDQSVNIISYVLKMREKMEETTNLVKRNLEEVQQQQQTWYDKSARCRSFKPGQKQQELEAIIPPDLFKEQPGATDLVEHDIRLKNSTPIRQRMYRIPEKMSAALKEEIEVMLKLGVIESSSSEWSNPVVLDSSGTVAVHKDAVWTPWGSGHVSKTDE
ncbi:uncharacterized protein V3H82_017174 [Fundulus diaphanus]